MAQVKISELTAKGSALQGTDLLEISQLVGSAYVSKSVNGGDIIDAAQSGMQSELISGTNIKTINSSSILGSGDLSVGTVTSVGLTTDALGTDVSVSGSPITGSGSITLSIPTASALNTGKLSKTDWTTFNNKQNALVSGTNIKTINGNSLLGSGDLVVGGGGLTIGTTAITSGTIGRILFEGTGNVVQESVNLFWDNTNSRLGIGTASPNMSLDIRTGNVGIGVTSDAGFKLDVNGSSRASSLVINGTSALFNSGISVFQNSTNRAFSVSASVTKSNGAERILFSLNSSELTNQQSMDFGYIGATALTNRYFYLQSSESGVGYGGGVVLQHNGGWASVGSSSYIASAVFHVASTNRGFLPPRMTTTQKNAIASPVAGLIVYDTTLNKLCVYTTAWETITSA